MCTHNSTRLDSLDNLDHCDNLGRAGRAARLGRTGQTMPSLGRPDPTWLNQTRDRVCETLPKFAIELDHGHVRYGDTL